MFYGLCFSEEENVDYVIGIGDVVQISVWQHEQFDGTAKVGPDGKITIYVLGDISVAGLTRKQAKAKIEELLLQYVKEGAEVTFSITEFNSQRISVVGAVRNPRTITFSIIPSLLAVLMVDSVPTPDADLTAVKILPVDPSIRKPFIVNLADAIEKGDVSNLPKLHSGDTIYVPRRKEEVVDTSDEPESEQTDVTPPQTDGTSTTEITSPETPTKQNGYVIHIMGAVRTPMSYTSTEQPTLTEVLLRAGGVSNSLSLKYVRIIRGSGVDKGEIVNVDMEKYLAEGDTYKLPEMNSGDTVYVPDVNQEKMRDVSIIITGQVLRPGTFNINGPLNILDAISMAGGLTVDADPERVRITREMDDTYQEKIVSIEAFLEDVGSTITPEIVEPGYRIYIPTRRKTSSIVGAVTHGIVGFLADLALVYSFYRLVRE